MRFAESAHHSSMRGYESSLALAHMARERHQEQAKRNTDQIKETETHLEEVEDNSKDKQEAPQNCT